MSSSAVQVRFAVEFATFLVAIAGAALVALRPALIGASSRARVILPAGFLLIAVAAFLHGSLVVGSSADSWVAAIRLAGIVLDHRLADRVVRARRNGGSEGVGAGLLQLPRSLSDSFLSLKFCPVMNRRHDKSGFAVVFRQFSRFGLREINAIIP